jgi:pre-rRNA-processing protein TSR1
MQQSRDLATQSVLILTYLPLCARCVLSANALSAVHVICASANHAHNWADQVYMVQGALPEYVPCGTFVRITLARVPQSSAEAVCGAVSDYLLGQRAPLTAFGLHKHECKLSVVNMAVTRSPEYDAPVTNKEDLLFATGLRTYRGRPTLSNDDYNADKHKLERFMHPGRSYVMSVYAPISFGPLPVLVFKQVCCAQALMPSAFTL